VNTTLVFRLSFIALFLFNYQITTIHSKHHHLGNITECYVCLAAKQTGERHHQPTLLHFSESVAIELSYVERHSITRKAYSWSKLPHYRLSDFDGLIQVNVLSKPLGYFSTAPPYFS